MNHSGRRGLYYFSFGELDLRGIRFCPIKLNLIKFAVKDFIVQGFNFPNLRSRVHPLPRTQTHPSVGSVLFFYLEK